jgi:hypothetical protein
MTTQSVDDYWWIILSDPSDRRLILEMPESPRISAKLWHDAHSYINTEVNENAPANENAPDIPGRIVMK